MALPLVLTAMLLLLALVALVEPFAQRLKIPSSVPLALIGITLGLLAVRPDVAGPLAPLAALFGELPLSAHAVMLILLPPLLFDAALRIDARRLLDDAPIVLVLSVLAVGLTTLAVGAVLVPISGEAFALCLLVGAIVATTDPIAVLSNLRNVGAPGRLIRIVEGESLFNDAAAIAIFTLLLGATAMQAVTFWDGALVFALTGVGGLAVGLLTSAAAGVLIALAGRHAAALTSITVALPYLAFIVCEEGLGISGATAVVVAGLDTARRAHSGRASSAWRHARRIWDQLGFWANGLVFVLAAFLVPSLLSRFDATLALSTAAMLVAAFAARAFVLWAPLELIQRAPGQQRVSHRARTLLWWGGVRGALTLLLALSVTESDTIAPREQAFVATLATAFTLFTIFVNGPTLRSFTRLLGLHRLSAFDRGLGAAAKTYARRKASERIEHAAAFYGLAREVEGSAAAKGTGPGDLADAPTFARGRVRLAFVVLAQAERAALNRHAEGSIITPRVAGRLNRQAQRLQEAARIDGRQGYLAAADGATRWDRGFRLAVEVQRRLGLRRPLASRVSERFERLFVARLLLVDLESFADQRVLPVMGHRVGSVCRGALARRRQDVSAALSAMSLQYPAFAAEVEERFLTRTALAAEAEVYAGLREDGIIGAEISAALQEELARANRRASQALKLDLSVDKRAMVAAVPLFANLPPDSVAAIARRLRTRFVMPGERIIARGERSEEVYFIASGAVEVDTGTMRVTLGKGSCVGEISAVLGTARTADVTLLGFGELLVLTGRAFRALLAQNADLRREVEALARRRRAAHRTAAPAPRLAV